MNQKIVELTNYRMFRVGDTTISVSENGHVLVSCWNEKLLCGEHYWNSRGSSTIWQFIAELVDDKQYVLKKLFDPHAIHELDIKQTRWNVAKEIVEAWRDKSIEKDEAHDLIDDLRQCESEHDFLNLQLGAVYQDSVYYSFSYKYKDCCEHWWSNVWVPFCLYVKETLVKK